MIIHKCSQRSSLQCLVLAALHIYIDVQMVGDVDLLWSSMKEDWNSVYALRMLVRRPARSNGQT